MIYEGFGFNDASRRAAARAFAILYLAKRLYVKRRIEA
jgi:hypothetical protein